MLLYTSSLSLLRILRGGLTNAGVHGDMSGGQKVRRHSVEWALCRLRSIHASVSPSLSTCVPCAVQPPVSTRFLEMRQFPGHQLIYLPPTAARELDAFAARLAAVGFSMHDSPFRQVHHFGVAFFEPEADECVRFALSTSEAPAGFYRFDFVQLYQFSVNAVRSLWRGRCAGVEAAV